MRRFQSLLLVVGTLVFVETGSAGAQTNYPNRPLQLVVTVPPGGAADFVARLIGAKLADNRSSSAIVVAPAERPPLRRSPNRTRMATRSC